MQTIRITSILLALAAMAPAQAPRTVEAVLHIRERGTFAPVPAAAVVLSVRGAWLPARTADANGRLIFDGAFELPVGATYPWMARDAAGRVGSGEFLILPAPAACKAMKRSTSFTLLVGRQRVTDIPDPEPSRGPTETKTELEGTTMLACGSPPAVRRFSTVYQDGATAVSGAHDDTRKIKVVVEANVSAQAKSKLAGILGTEVSASANESEEQTCEVEITRKWTISPTYPGRCGRVSVYDDVVELTWSSWTRTCEVHASYGPYWQRTACVRWSPWVRTTTWVTTVVTGVCVLDETVSCSTLEKKADVK